MVQFSREMNRLIHEYGLVDELEDVDILEMMRNDVQDLITNEYEFEISELQDQIDELEDRKRDLEDDAYEFEELGEQIEDRIIEIEDNEEGDN